MDLSEPQMLSVNQVRAALNVSRNTMYRLIDAGYIRATRFGPNGRWMIPASELERLEQEAQPQPLRIPELPLTRLRPEPGGVLVQRSAEPPA